MNDKKHFIKVKKEEEDRKVIISICYLLKINKHTLNLKLRSVQVNVKIFWKFSILWYNRIPGVSFAELKAMQTRNS